MANIAQFQTFATTPTPQPTPVPASKRDFVVGQLKLGIRTVTFKKADGTIAIHEATLADFLMPHHKRSSFANRAENEHVVSFYSITRQDWRSFRVDSLIACV
jgi:hypothetical protein